MCLTSVYGEGILAWKVFKAERPEDEGQYRGEYVGLYRAGQWYDAVDAREERMEGYPGLGHIGLYAYYKPGFHALKSQKDAERYALLRNDASRVTAVKLRGVHTEGRDYLGSAVWVAEQMMIPACLRCGEGPYAHRDGRHGTRLSGWQSK